MQTPRLTAWLLGLVVAASAAEVVGVRPYELDWAGRTQDDQVALVDFEDLAGWTVRVQDAEAAFECSREQQIWGEGVGRLAYRATGPAPEVRILPPAPIPISAGFDAVSCWIYGNNWGFSPNPATPPVLVQALFLDAAGGEFMVHLTTVNWEEWFLCERRLAPAQIALTQAGGVRFAGFLISNGRNKAERTLYFDSLCVFTEAFAPLTFAPRPERGIAMFPGQSAGTNTGPGKLPFPTRPETILPENLAKDAKTAVTQSGADQFLFTYEGSDGKLVYRLEPKTGTFTDLTAEWTGGGPAFQPGVGGGVYLAGPTGPVLPETAEHVGTTLAGQDVTSRWRLSAGALVAEATFTYRLWGKSLVIDVVAPGGMVAEVRYGRARGLQEPRLVTNPFYPASGGRPAVVVSGSAAAPLFVTGNTDWYLSNASEPWATNAVDQQGVLYNGGTRYLPKTDGKRNDCYERLFLTVSPRYEEMLPVIPNPVSPWKQVTGTRLWRAHGAGNRESDAQHWRECQRWGMTQVIVTDHETGWRDGGESFTFRTRTAPGKGGDEGQAKYARIMQDELGFVYGPYNNYTDFAPVNEFWTPDLIARGSDNQLQTAWMRCYAPKPTRAVEYCAQLAPMIQEKFGFSTAYCDVHTAVAPWHRVDYDARVPGAGSFAAVFYLYGEIMLHQKQAWNGPVYSEGNHHSFYSGLTDGNYGQDQAYRPAENPWLVDFDLRRMHDLCCNFGMGNPEMFYANEVPDLSTRAQQEAWIDRFLAATVAFGHPGFLTYEGGFQNALRSYYMLQQLHSRYCLASAVDIRYVDAAGRLLETSAAVASGAYRRSQVVTRYSDGTVTAANGDRSERLRATAFGRALDLPPNGYAGWTADGTIEVQAGEVQGCRGDYAATPAYLYVDGRGRMLRFAKAAGNGIGICRILPEGGYEVLLYKDADCGFAIAAGAAVALDRERREIGPAPLRVARGVTYVIPVPGAFSYRLSAGTAPAGVRLACDRDDVVPGERLSVRGAQTHEWQVPADARPGQRLWQQFEGAWIDFTVVPMADATLRLDGNTLALGLRSNLAARADFTVSAAGRQATARVEPGQDGEVRLDLGVPEREDAGLLTVEIRVGDLTQQLVRGMRIASVPAPVVALPEEFAAGMCLRGQAETSDFGTSSGYVIRRQEACGEVTKSCVFMHPPYTGRVGYAFARYAAVKLPVTPPAAFRAVVGKGDGSHLGDGIQYRLLVHAAAGQSTVAAEQTVTRHEWVPIEADLSRWAGQEIAIQLISDVGPADDSSGDWACWADLRLETKAAMLVRSLDADAEKYRREPGPYPQPGITVDQLRGARKGWLRYDGMGLEGDSPVYGSTAVLNGVELGAMARAGGSEAAGVWAEKVGVELSAAAIASLGLHNRFVLRNPQNDCFKVRRFWIELELADGRRCSSQVAPAVYTQPASWAYAEGILVPHGQEIDVDLWF
jgi:hypothetical protein